MNESFKEYLRALLHIFYPRLCLSCNYEWPIKASPFCFECILQMSYGVDFLQRENAFMEKFYGRVPLVFGASLINFYKKSTTQEMMHRFKYKHQRQVGEVLGKELAQKLKLCPFFKTPDLIIPVPLTWKKENRRGYNQAWIIANEISKILDIPIRKDVLVKKKETQTMSKKNRAERSLSVSNSLFVKSPKTLKGKHILLVDDVLTTGATLESCALKLMDHGIGLLSFVTLATAKSR